MSSKSEFGPTIGSIQLPSNTRGHRRNRKSRKEIKAEGMRKCKELYSTLQNEAIPTVAAYIIAYERAIETSEAADRQLEKAIKDTMEIKEEYRDDVINEIRDLQETNKEYRAELTERNNKLNDLLGEFNRFSQEIIRRNKILDEMSLELPMARGHNRY